MENTTSPTLPTHWLARFITIWIGQQFSLIGSALVQFALIWWLTSKTGSATILATASLVALLPQIVLGPFVGALIDRWNRRIIMIVADSSIAAATAILIVLFATGHIQIWHIFAILLIRSLGGAFHYPAMAASTSLMVPREHLARISGMNQTVQGVVSIVSPPVGAWLLAVLQTHQILMIDIGTAAFAILPLLFISIPVPPRQAAQANGDAQQTSYWHDLRDGLAYVGKWPGLFGMILLAMLLNFMLIPSSSLLPLIVKNEFRGGALELGWVETSFGVGIVVGGLILSAWGGFRRRIVTSLIGVIGIGLGVVATGLAPAGMLYLLLAACFITGFTQVFANGPLNAIFQSAVEPDMQGRVMSLISAGATAMMPLSLLVAGPVSDWLGVRAWYLIGGGSCILATLVAFFIPAIMNIENNKSGAPSEASAMVEQSQAAP
jgi:DHA3 family macrolide efflux protein-like MFS transporter